MGAMGVGATRRFLRCSACSSFFCARFTRRAGSTDGHIGGAAPRSQATTVHRPAPPPIGRLGNKGNLHAMDVEEC